MPDLQSQIRAYAEQLDAATPPVIELGDVSRPERRRVRRPVPAWAAVAAAALVAVVSVGVVVLLNRTPADVADTSVPPTPSITTPDTSALEFTMLVPDPVFTGGEGGNSLGYDHAGPGGVTVVDGVFHALRSGGKEGGSVVLYSTSADGITWEDTAEPALRPEDVPWPAESASVSSLLRAPDGSWIAYFATVQDTGGHGDHFFEQRIGRATAEDPSGPWVIDDEPVLLPGAPGSWDDYELTFPAVTAADGGYVMYYAGGQQDKPAAIGRATSADGVVWVKDPNPVLTGLEAPSWEDGGLHRPDVLRTDAGWILTFARRTGGVRGIAFSADGIAWERHPGNPVLDTADVPRGALFTTSLVERDGDFYWFVQAGGSRTGSETYLMIHEGPLR